MMLEVTYKVVKKKTFWTSLLEWLSNVGSPYYMHTEIIEYRDAVRRWKKMSTDASDLSKILNSGKEFEPTVMEMLREYVDTSNNLRRAIDVYEKEHLLTSK